MPSQPDEGEYTVGAWRLANLGQYNIVILNKVYPDRYSPGFPLLLSVVYKIFPSDLGNGIFAVFMAAMCGVVITWYIGKRFGSLWCAAFAVLALLMVKDYRLGSTTILSDTPGCVLALLSCLLYLRIRNVENKGAKYSEFLLAGVTIGYAFSMRYELLSLSLPFLVESIRLLVIRADRSKGVKSILLFSFPVIFSILGNLIYNKAEFGSPFMTGYNYWCAFPYDFPNILWSYHNILLNLITMESPNFIGPVVLGLIGIILLKAYKHPLLNDYTAFLILATISSSILHLFYAFASTRFYLVPEVLLQIIGGIGIGYTIHTKFEKQLWILTVLLGLCQPAVPTIYNIFRIIPKNRILISYLKHNTPNNAIIVSGLDPVYLNWYLQRNSSRTIVPVGRGAAYGSLLIFPKGRPHPAVLPRIHHVRTPAMLAAGGIDSIPWTAMGHPDLLLKLSRTGRPVYLEKVNMPLSYPNAATLSLFMVEPVNDSQILSRLIPIKP